METGAQSYERPTERRSARRAMYAYIQRRPLESRRARCTGAASRCSKTCSRTGSPHSHGTRHPRRGRGDCGSTIFVSGSFRLGVCGPGSDIDVICVVPSFCGGEAPGHFFRSFLSELTEREDVTNVVPIPDAAVPMIGLQLSGVEIDLLVAVMPGPNASLTHDQLLDDSVLQGIDDKSAKTLNGPRVTELLFRLTKRNYHHFQLCLRFLRHWARSVAFTPINLATWCVNFQSSPPRLL